MQLSFLAQLVTIALMAVMPIAEAAPVNEAPGDVALAVRHHTGKGGKKAAKAGNPLNLLGLAAPAKGNAKRHHTGKGKGLKGGKKGKANKREIVERVAKGGKKGKGNKGNKGNKGAAAGGPAPAGKPAPPAGPPGAGNA